jgi:hypothetical protein
MRRSIYVEEASTLVSGGIGRVGLLWRGDRDAREKATAENNRLRPVFEALAVAKISAEPVVFGDDMVDEVRHQLLQLDGVLVWVDPIMAGQDRSSLDALLSEVSSAGVWVSAHPDVILKMGTKDVLFATRDLGWGAETCLYRTMDQFRNELPARLVAGRPRVLKQYRGNGGIGVWKVELIASDRTEMLPGADAIVRVQHARARDSVTEDMPLVDFMERCAEYFVGPGRMVDQPFQPRIADGMVRCYMVRGEVVGFAHQWPEELTVQPSKSTTPRNIFGLPAQKTMYRASEPRFQSLRASMESDWVPAMQRLVDVDDDTLPMLWDADFLYGPKTEADEDTYVLCEINVSSVYPFPEQAAGKVAGAVAARLTSAR